MFYFPNKVGIFYYSPGKDFLLKAVSSAIIICLICVKSSGNGIEMAGMKPEKGTIYFLFFFFKKKRSLFFRY